MTTTREYSDVEYVFEPHSAALPDLREYLSALWERRAFMVALARSDLRSLRSSTALGNIWGVLEPLFMAGIYYFIYAILRAGSAERLRFLPILIGDIFLFGLTTAALGEGGGSIKRAKGLMLNSTFPRALLPVTSVYKSLRKFVPSACVFAVLFVVVGGNLGPGLFVLPLLFAIQVVMNVGISLLVATFVTVVPDANNLMAYVTRLLFFGTPIIYPIGLLPPGAWKLVGWQPLFPLFASYQAIFGGGMPNLLLVAFAGVWAVVLVLIGGRVFLRREREFALHL